MRYFSFNFSAFGQEDWYKCCKKVESVEKSYWATDIAVDEEMEKVVIRLDDSFNDVESFSSSDESDSDSSTVPGVCFIHFMVIYIKD